MARWAPALRMARRDLRRHPGRSLLVLLLVMLPIAAATCAATVQHDRRWEGENAARQTLGGADALVVVSYYPRVREYRNGDGGLEVRPAEFTRKDGKRVPVRRDPASVDLGALLPRGSRIVPAPDHNRVALSTGGTVEVLLLDAGDPMTRGLAEVSRGAVPTKRDEVAVPVAMADELGLLDAGRLRPRATLETATGTRLRVVGLTPTGRGSVVVLAPPASVLAPPPTPGSYLVDLPPMGTPALHALDRTLRDHGVGLLPRDAYFHPRQWGNVYNDAGPVDASAVALGAAMVLLGLVEVVLVVGAALAVGARRQVREVGLLAANGGAPADVRRVLLAQGAVVGVVGTVLGAAAGVALSGAALTVYEHVKGTTVWAHDIPWTAVAVICVLGSLTGLAAALVPAFGIGRLSPVAALDGSFPVRPGESRAHRPAFVLAATGLVMLAAGGLWAAREFAPRPEAEPYHSPSSLPVALSGLGALLLVAGVVWSAPFAVRLVARLGSVLPVSGRYAFRDAARHRFRTAAAGITLTVTVAGTLFIGFATASASADSALHGGGPPHSFTTYFDASSTTGGPEQVQRTLRTLRTVLGAPRMAVAGQAYADRGDRHYLEANARGYGETVGVLDPAGLRLFVDPGQADRAVAALRRGEVVTTVREIVRHGTVRLRVANQKHGAGPWQRQATVLTRSAGTGQDGALFSTWVSPQTASALGLRTRAVTVLAMADRDLTSADVTRLAVRGIDGWTPDLQGAQVALAGRLVLAAAALVTLVVAGIAVALAAAEGRSDTATLAAVGAGPGRRRRMGAAHGLLLGLVGLLLGLVVGVPAGAAVLQVDGLPGLAVPWELLAGIVFAVPVLSALAGWVVTPGRLELVRRTG